MKAFFAQLLLSISKVSLRKWFLIVCTVVGIGLLVFEKIDFEQLIKFLLAVAGIPLMIQYGPKLFLSVGLFVMLMFGLSNCMSYQKALRKFAQNKVDTVYVTETITQSVPADSISYLIPLDHISKIDTKTWVESPGKTRLILQPEVYENVKYVRIEAKCPEKQVSKTITRPRQIITKNTWGVDPRYKTWCKIFGFTLLGLVVLLTLGFWLRKVKLFF